MSTPCSLLPLLFWPLLLLSLSHWLFAVALAIALAVAVAVAFDLPGSLPKRRPWRGKTPQGRQGQDAPSANPRHGRGPVARSAEGARQGALSFGYFSLREQRKVTRRKAKAFAVVLVLVLGF
ncbi:hypothetical protein [Xanthomonas graminis]|uniref:hypothetical protein n=1 Tax=Xanthomonas graminis TaxID=3390026 RepID=UPI001F3DFDEA|nr:hypothetical protein [Xanthomonas translucens]